MQVEGSKEDFMNEMQEMEEYDRKKRQTKRRMLRKIGSMCQLERTTLVILKVEQ